MNGDQFNFTSQLSQVSIPAFWILNLNNFNYMSKYKCCEIKIILPTWRYIVWCIVRHKDRGPTICKNNVLIHRIIKSTTPDHSKSHLDLLVCRNSLILLSGVLSGLIVTGSGRSISLFKTQIYCIDYLLIFVRKLISTEEEHFFRSKLFTYSLDDNKAKSRVMKKVRFA